MWATNAVLGWLSTLVDLGHVKVTKKANCWYRVNPDLGRLLSVASVPVYNNDNNDRASYDKNDYKTKRPSSADSNKI